MFDQKYDKGVNRCKVWLGNWEVKHAKSVGFTTISIIIVFTLTNLLFQLLSLLFIGLIMPLHTYFLLPLIALSLSLCSHFIISFFQTNKNYLRIARLNHYFNYLECSILHQHSSNTTTSSMNFIYFVIN